MLKKIFRYIIFIFSWVFLVGLVYQMYTAGLAAVTRTVSWRVHGEFGFLLLIASLVQFLLVLPAGLPKPAGWVGFGVFATLMAQLLLVSDRDLAISALHPVLALFLFYMAWWLAVTAARSLRTTEADRQPSTEGGDA